MTLECPICHRRLDFVEPCQLDTITCDCGAAVHVPQFDSVITAELVDGSWPEPTLRLNQNPYAAPQADHALNHGALGATAPGTAGIWRQGRTLIMHQSAVLPNICVKSNGPADGGRVTRKLAWHPSWVGLTLLISPLVYVILAAVLTKKATIQIALSSGYRRRGRLALAFSIFTALSAGFIAAAGGWLGWFDDVLIASLLAFVIVVAALLVGHYSSRMIRPVKITDSHVHIRGCHPDFLARFPQFPTL